MTRLNSYAIIKPDEGIKKHNEREKEMQSTLIFSANGNLIISKTLAETAKKVTDMRGNFHAKDILFALEVQALALENIRSI